MIQQDDGPDSAPRQRPSLTILWILAAAILLAAAVRTWLGAQLFFQQDVVHRIIALACWRDLDQFSCWFSVLILALADQFAGGRGTKFIPWILALGMLVLFVSIFLADDHTKAITELAAVCILALAAALVSVRQLAGITSLSRRRSLPDAPRGITIEQLWRLFAVQWMLVWIAAEIFLRVKFRGPGASAQEPARNLLFALPAFGVGPIVLMAVGIRWWTIMRVSHLDILPRPRAWLLALGAVNLGAISFVIGGLPGEGKKWFIVFGAVPMIAGLWMYVLGFGRQPWPLVVLRALGLFFFACGVILLVDERLDPPGAGGALWESTAAWRFFVGTGFILMWLVWIGVMAMLAWTGPHLRAPFALWLSYILLSLGIITTGSILLLAGFCGHEWLAGIAPASLLLLLGLIVATATTLRLCRFSRS